MKKENLLGLALLVISSTMVAFVPPEDFSACKKELKKYVDELAKINSPVGKNVYYMSITIKTDMSAESRIPDSETSVQVYMSANQLHYVSDVLETYQDDINTFAILPRRKMIVWSHGGKRADANEKKQMAIHIQDTLITLSKVISCQRVEENGKTLTILTMVPHKRAIDVFKVNRIEYFIDPTKKRIEKVNTYYLPMEEISVRSITYHELNLNYNKAKLQKPAYRQIFSESNKLLAKYNGYQIVDNRN